jgi:hypothetical protein
MPARASSWWARDPGIDEDEGVATAEEDGTADDEAKLAGTARATWAKAKAAAMEANFIFVM